MENGDDKKSIDNEDSNGEKSGSKGKKSQPKSESKHGEKIKQKKENETDPNWWKKIPVPTLYCWLVYQKLLSSKNGHTAYFLTKYAKPFKDYFGFDFTYYKIRKWLSGWKESGLVESEIAYDDSPTELYKITGRGRSFGGKVGGYYDGPSPT